MEAGEHGPAVLEEAPVWSASYSTSTRRSGAAACELLVLVLVLWRAASGINTLVERDPGLAGDELRGQIRSRSRFLCGFCEPSVEIASWMLRGKDRRCCNGCDGEGKSRRHLGYLYVVVQGGLRCRFRVHGGAQKPNSRLPRTANHEPNTAAAAR